MPSDLKPLQDFFKNRVFRIPDYQRGYAWGKSQLDAFWQDLNRIPKGRNHYTGQITLEPVAEDRYTRWDEDTWLITEANHKPYYVVDGQQRLTTAVILLKCLLDLVQDDGEVARTPKSELVRTYLFRQSGVSRSYVFGYEKDNPSYEYLKTQILDQPSNAFQGIETIYTANLRIARDYFAALVKGSSPTQIDDWFRRITQRFLVNEYELDSDLDVFVAFETMNNRGKPLSRLELLKNRLIYLSTLVPVTEDEQRSLRRNINEAWKTIYEYLGKEAGYPLDDDTFLRAHWIMYFKYDKKQADQFSAFLLEEHFTTNNVADGTLTAANIQDFVNSIQNSVKAWHDIHFPTAAAQLSDSVRGALERCDRVGRGAFAPLIMAALQHQSAETELVALLESAERFVFVVSHLCRKRADTGDSDFYRLARAVNTGKTNLGAAASQIHDRTDKEFLIDTAKAAMKELFEKDEGFYAWKGRYYFLFEYEQYLKNAARMGAAKVNWSEFRLAKDDHVTIEHIYPRDPRAGDWPGFEGRPDGEQHRLLHSLGNLLPLSRSRNSKFSNRDFASKRQDSDAVGGYFNGSYSEIEVAQSAAWTPLDVLVRGGRMLDFLESRWKISLGTRIDRVNLLGLEFLESGNPS